MVRVSFGRIITIPQDPQDVQHVAYNIETEPELLDHFGDVELWFRNINGEFTPIRDVADDFFMDNFGHAAPEYYSQLLRYMRDGPARRNTQQWRAASPFVTFVIDGRKVVLSTADATSDENGLVLNFGSGAYNAVEAQLAAMIAAREEAERVAAEARADLAEQMLQAEITEQRRAQAYANSGDSSLTAFNNREEEKEKFVKSRNGYNARTEKFFVDKRAELDREEAAFLAARDES